MKKALLTVLLLVLTGCANMAPPAPVTYTAVGTIRNVWDRYKQEVTMEYDNKESSVLLFDETCGSRAPVWAGERVVLTYRSQVGNKTFCFVSAKRID